MSTQIACRQLLELISGYLDGALPADTRAAVEAHLSGCDGCAMVLDEFRTTIEMTGHLTEAQLTPSQRATLLAAFRGWAGP
jgi:anti-sigma factor RsiW